MILEVQLYLVRGYHVILCLLSVLMESMSKLLQALTEMCAHTQAVAAQGLPALKMFSGERRMKVMNDG